MIADLLEEYKKSGGGTGKKSKSTRNNINYSYSNKSHSGSNQYYNGSPKQVVFKIIKNIDKATGKPNRNAGYACMKNLEYIATDKEELDNDSTTTKLEDNLPLNLETDDGRILTTKKEIFDFYKEWEDTFTDRKDGKDFEHLIISPEDLNVEDSSKLLDATRQMLQKEFGNEGYNYAFNLHTNTKNPHAHVTMRVHNTTKNERLDIKKAKIWDIKVAAANELKNQGLNYEASVNFDRILGISSKLEYVKSHDLSWFQANVKKLEDTNIEELGSDIKRIEMTIQDLIKQRKENTALTKEQKVDITKNIEELSTEKRLIIRSINGLEYDLQNATKNYKSLSDKQNKISWYLQNTKAYKELSLKVNEAQKLVLQKKIEIDKVQLYLNESKSQLSFSDQLKKNTLDYINENIDNTNDINKILSQLNILETKLPNSNIVKQIHKLKNGLLENEELYKYEQQAKNFLKNDLAAASFTSNNKKQIDKIINKLDKGFDVYDYDLRSINFNVYNYSFRSEDKTNECINIDDSNRELINKYINKSEIKDAAKIIDRIKKDNIVYKHQLNTLKIDHAELLKELKIENFENIITKENVLDFGKSFVDKENKIIGNDFIEVLKDIKLSNSKITSNDDFTNRYIKGVDKKIDDLINKIDSGKEISLDHVKKTGLDTDLFETYQKTYSVDHLKNSVENLKEFEKLKPYFDKDLYSKLHQDIKENNLSNKNLDFAFEKAEITSLPIDMKLSFEMEKKDITSEMISIDSVKKYLDQDVNKQNTKETVTTAIFNSGKFFDSLSSRLNNELGIELNSPHDLATNLNNIGKQSELRELINDEIHIKISEFRDINDLKDDNKFNEYQDKLNDKKNSKTKLNNEEKELNNLTGFLQKNKGLYPIFENDLKKIDLNTLEFSDTVKTLIKVEVIPINDDTYHNINKAFDQMINNSEDNINKTKINETDLQAIKELEHKFKRKAEFKDAANQYLKVAINTKETKRFLSATLDKKTLNGMQYMIQEKKIKDLPKTFLESRKIDTAIFPTEKKDKKVYAIKMGSAENLEVFKNKENFKLANDNKIINDVKPPANIKNEIMEITDKEYNDFMEDIKDIDFNELDINNKKDFDTFYKLDSIRDKAVNKKDFETLEMTYKKDAPVDLSSTIKEYGKVLNIDVSYINKQIWIESGGNENDYKGFGDSLVKELPDYKEQFTDKYLNDLSSEYLFKKYDSVSNEEEYKHIESDIKNFDILISKFKEELDTNREHKKYLDQLDAVKEQLKNGDFKNVVKEIQNINYENEIDKKNLEYIYSQAIDIYAKDENLNDLKKNIESESNITFKSYEIDPGETPNKKQNKVIKEKRTPGIKQPEKLNKESNEKTTNPKVMNDKTPGIKKIDYDSLKLEYDHKTKEFKDALSVALKESIDTQKSKDYQDMMFYASKSIASELKRNIKQIENTKVLIDTVPKFDKYEKNLLDKNLIDFKDKAISLNTYLNTYIEKLHESSLTNTTKQEYKLDLYEELNKHDYSERIIDSIPDIKNNIIDRNLDHFKTINNLLKNPKLEKSKEENLIDKGSALLKVFNKCNPSWMQERSITKLHKEQSKNLSQKHRGLER